MAKMTIEQFREFAGAVVRQLPQVSSEDAQLLIDEQDRLAAVLRGAFRPAHVDQFDVLLTPKWHVEDFANLLIELECPFDGLAELVDEKNLNKGDYHSSMIVDNWPKEEKKIDFRIFSPGREMTGFEVVAEMRRNGLRPARIVETIFFAAQYKLHIKEKDFSKFIVLEGFYHEDTPHAEVFGDRETSFNERGDRYSEWMGTCFWTDAKYAAVVG